MPKVPRVQGHVLKNMMLNVICKLRATHFPLLLGGGCYRSAMNGMNGMLLTDYISSDKSLKKPVQRQPRVD